MNVPSDLRGVVERLRERAWEERETAESRPIGDTARLLWFAQARARTEAADEIETCLSANRGQGEARYSQEKIVELLRKGVEGHKKQAALMLGMPAAIRSEGAADALEAAANIIERGPAPADREQEA